MFANDNPGCYIKPCFKHCYFKQCQLTEALMLEIYDVCTGEKQGYAKLERFHKETSACYGESP